MVRLQLTDQYAELWILLIGLIIVLHLYSRVRDKKRAMKFGNYETLQKVADGSLLSANHFQTLVSILAVSAVLAGLSTPTLIYEETGAESDFALAIDKSASMFTSDVEPNRFEAAKQSSVEFVEEAGNQTEIGVVSYAGEVENHQDPTDDHQLVQNAIEDIEMGETPGTATGDAVAAAGSMLLASEEERTVILFTDGRRNVGQTINESIDFANRHNITVHSIGIGEQDETEEAGTDIIDGEEAEQISIPNLEQENLNRLAEETGGEAVFATEADAMTEAILELTSEEAEQDVSNYFFIAAGILLVLEAFLRTTKFNPIP